MSGSIQDMNNRVNQNRSLQPSNRSRFKDHLRQNIYTDTQAPTTKLSFKKVSEIELNKINRKIRLKALKDKNRNTIYFIAIVLVLLITGLFLFKP
ncbi:hypothetical protein EHW67_13085 [Arenibacter aquaticus]|uniref:Uncharacterized protein n=1 Tax=Arenibacter aquaticus TaxID=2489054 RepID=A0A430K2E5_9FLAO|nr:hypothetical protein [Arenibacter aquaticus]RTE53109.1 hypothetical protein EHW67_13085 [Arenibacter aquaticus]